MDFEVFFRLKNKELARYQFAVETPADIQAGFINALEAFRVQHPEVDACRRHTYADPKEGWVKGLRRFWWPSLQSSVESLNALPSTELRRRRSASDMLSCSRQRSRS